jgi:hypothetical protein
VKLTFRVCLGAVPSCELDAVPFSTSVRFILIIEHQNHGQYAPYPIRCQAKCAVPSVPYSVRCTINDMRVKISPEVRAAMAEVARAYGKMGGKTSFARNRFSVPELFGGYPRGVAGRALDAWTSLKKSGRMGCISRSARCGFSEHLSVAAKLFCDSHRRWRASAGKWSLGEPQRNPTAAACILVV